MLLVEYLYDMEYAALIAMNQCAWLWRVHKFEWLCDWNEKPDTFGTEVDTGQESLSVDLMRGCLHETPMSDGHVKVWKPGEQDGYYDFEAKCRTEPMILSSLTGDVCAINKQIATGIETKADYSGEQSEFNLEHECSKKIYSMCMQVQVRNGMDAKQYG